MNRLVQGFSNAVCTSLAADGSCATTQTINYPSFAGLLPAGVTPQTAATCPDDPRTTTTNESTVALNRAQCRGIRTERANTGRSWYDSLQMRYAGRFLNNSLSVNGAYTFGKTLDNTSEVFTFGTEGNIISANPYDYTAAEKSISNLHRKHLASLTFIYDFRSIKSRRVSSVTCLAVTSLTVTSSITARGRLRPARFSALASSAWEILIPRPPVLMPFEHSSASDAARFRHGWYQPG